MIALLVRRWPLLIALAVAYLLPFLLLDRGAATATACTAISYTCISEGSDPSTTRLYAGQITSSESHKGVHGGIAATSTSLVAPTQNGFTWYGVTTYTAVWVRGEPRTGPSRIRKWHL
jgi:hypothetical protein